MQGVAQMPSAQKSDEQSVSAAQPPPIEVAPALPATQKPPLQEPVAVAVQ